MPPGTKATIITGIVTSAATAAIIGFFAYVGTSIGDHIDNIKKIPIIEATQKKHDASIQKLSKSTARIVGQSTAGTNIDVPSGSPEYNVGLDVTVTPKMTTSKIMIIVSGRTGVDGAAGRATGSWYFIKKTMPGGGEKTIRASHFHQNIHVSPGKVHRPTTLICIDEPKTTSAIKYSVTIKQGGPGTASFMDGKLVAIELQ